MDVFFWMSIYVFILSAFVGFEVITKVPPMLHTPLMSGTNAISGITLLGALVATSKAEATWELWVGSLAIFLATINVVGGYLVTGRMLRMFRRK